MKFNLPLMSDFRNNYESDHKMKELKREINSIEEPRVTDADLVATDSYSKIIRESELRGYSKYSYRFNTSQFMSHIDHLKRRYHDKKYALFVYAFAFLMMIFFGVLFILAKAYFLGIITIILGFLAVYYLQWQDNEIRKRIPERNR